MVAFEGSIGVAGFEGLVRVLKREEGSFGTFSVLTDLEGLEGWKAGAGAAGCEFTSEVLPPSEMPLADLAGLIFGGEDGREREAVCTAGVGIMSVRVLNGLETGEEGRGGAEGGDGAALEVFGLLERPFIVGALGCGRG